MKRFSFSLQKVLDFREFEKKQAETELGKAVAEETKIENNLELIAKQRVETVATADGVHDINALYGINQYFQLLDQRKEKLLEDLTKAKLVTEEKRDVMREAMKKCKVLENLKEQRMAVWKKDEAKREENEIDDIVTSKYNAQEKNQ